MIKSYAGMTCEEIYEAALKDWRFIARGLIYSEETERRFAETVARLWADFATETFRSRSSATAFTVGLTRFTR